MVVAPPSVAHMDLRMLHVAWGAQAQHPEEVLSHLGTLGQAYGFAALPWSCLGHPYPNPALPLWDRDPAVCCGTGTC